MTTNEVEQLKQQGNAAFSAGNYKDSISYFTSALELDSTNHIIWSNRSASYASLRDYDSALTDADRAIALKPDWPKGHGRRGAALLGLGRLQDAKCSYQSAVDLDPENVQLKKGLEMVSEMEREMGDQYKPVDNPFSDPMIWEKLKGDAKMREYMEDAEFRKVLDEIKSDPKSLTKHISDPRITRAFSVMLGVDLELGSNTSGGEAKSKSTRDTGKNSGEFEHNSDALKKSNSSTTTTTTATTLTTPALKEKELGNEAYKRRDFEGALHHYDAAIELDPENISILTNKSAVFFEMGEYQKCITLCEEAVERGRAAYADFKLLAKALGRIGSCYERLGDLETAVNFFQKSLTEHRTADILNKLKEAEQLLDQQRKNAYHSPELAEKERNLGNDLFKQGDYSTAIKHYTEAIRRDESDPRSYSNRAACYLKLAAVPEGLKDCDRALQLDPTFVKAYLRKAHLLHLRRDYGEALNALDAAAQHDPEGRHTSEIQSLSARCYTDMRGGTETEEEILARAMQNPEIREILNDPVMGQILRQMQADPKAVQEHLRNPQVAQKLRKLIAAGVIKTH